MLDIKRADKEDEKINEKEITENKNPFNVYKV